MAVPEVDKVMLRQLELMGFPTARATRALHSSGNCSIEAAVNWVIEHENDPDIDQIPLVPKEIKIESGNSLLISEEVKLKAHKEQASQKKLDKNRSEREKEKEITQSAGKLMESKRVEDDSERKRMRALLKAKEEEQKRARERVRQQLEDDKAERKRKLGVPYEDLGASKPATPRVEEQRQSPRQLPAKRVTKAELRDCLRNLKRNYKDDNARVKRAFETLLKIIGNIVNSPDEEKFRRLRLSNPKFHSWVFERRCRVSRAMRLRMDRRRQILVSAEGESRHGSSKICRIGASFSFNQSILWTSVSGWLLIHLQINYSPPLKFLMNMAFPA
ncbi:UBX domain-containing protein 1-like isoform X2 [Ananas comosus]|uniref:UBX domain-containing protein 1-like isoform X2 n=1 Tax=Ananas comosus TaxID=4615 RepID=A0A6P5G5L2_ANACO|nr:UBX domain-containing protein 1-like isoform X2 [Ananas comosus]